VTEVPPAAVGGPRSGGAHGCVEGAEVNGRAAGSTSDDGGYVLVGCSWGLRPTSGAGVSSCRVGGLGGHMRCRRAVGHSGRRRAVGASHVRPRLATADRSARQLPRPLFVVARVALPWWRSQGAGWRVSEALWWCSRLRLVSLFSRICRRAAYHCIKKESWAKIALHNTQTHTPTHTDRPTQTHTSTHNRCALCRQQPDQKWLHTPTTSCAA
jgi:hypothetical protein